MERARLAPGPAPHNRGFHDGWHRTGIDYCHDPRRGPDRRLRPDLGAAVRHGRRRRRLRERAQRREVLGHRQGGRQERDRRTACRTRRACSRARSARSARPRPSAPSDVVQRIAKLKEAVGAYESYLKKFPTGEKAAIARLKLSEWLRTAGEIVAPPDQEGARRREEGGPEERRPQLLHEGRSPQQGTGRGASRGLRRTR